MTVLDRFQWALDDRGVYTMTGESLAGALAEARAEMLRDVLAFLRDECVQFDEAASNVETYFALQQEAPSSRPSATRLLASKPIKTRAP